MEKVPYERDLEWISTVCTALLLLLNIYYIMDIFISAGIGPEAEDITGRKKDMKFTCSANTLTEALQIVTKALPGRTTNQILEGILVQTDMNEVILTCSDERITIVTRMEAHVKRKN